MVDDKQFGVLADKADILHETAAVNIFYVSLFGIFMLFRVHVLLISLPVWEGRFYCVPNYSAFLKVVRTLNRGK